MGFLTPFNKVGYCHRGEDLEAKGPQLAKNLRLRHSEIFLGCGNCGNWLVLKFGVFSLCVCGSSRYSLPFPILLLSLYIDHVLLVVVERCFLSFVVVCPPCGWSSSLVLFVHLLIIRC